MLPDPDNDVPIQAVASDATRHLPILHGCEVWLGLGRASVEAMRRAVASAQQGEGRERSFRLAALERSEQTLQRFEELMLTLLANPTLTAEHLNWWLGCEEDRSVAKNLSMQPPLLFRCVDAGAPDTVLLAILRHPLLSGFHLNWRVPPVRSRAAVEQSGILGWSGMGAAERGTVGGRPGDGVALTLTPFIKQMHSSKNCAGWEVEWAPAGRLGGVRPCIFLQYVAHWEEWGKMGREGYSFFR